MRIILSRYARGNRGLCCYRIERYTGSRDYIGFQFNFWKYIVAFFWKDGRKVTHENP